MDRQEIFSELKNIIGEHLKAQGLNLVDLIYRYEGRGLVLRVLLDRPEGGISLEECARLNTEISELLDEKDVLNARYIMEVSSPGLDRPLKTRSDFLRCIDRRVRFFLAESVNGKMEWAGTIIKVEEEAVCLDIGGEPVKVPLAKIIQAKQVIDII